MSSDRSIQDSVLEMMRQHLEAANLEMFSDFDICVRSVPTGSPHLMVRELEPAIVAVIGYVGDGIRGALTMIASDAAIASWVARMGSEGSDTSDALGEFSNMLLGRLKARLLPEGLTIQLTTPTIATGRELRLSTPPSGSVSLSFEEPAGKIRLRLDAHFEPGFDLRQQDHLQGPPAQAGEAILF